MIRSFVISVLIKIIHLLARLVAWLANNSQPAGQAPLMLTAAPEPEPEYTDYEMMCARLLPAGVIEQDLQEARAAVDPLPFLKRITELHQACQMIGPKPLQDMWVMWASQAAWDAWVEGTFHEDFYVMIQLMEDVIKALVYDWRFDFFQYAHAAEWPLTSGRLEHYLLEYCKGLYHHDGEMASTTEGQ